MKLEFSQQIFEKYSTLRFHENPPRAEFHADGQADMVKLRVTFQDFANATNKVHNHLFSLFDFPFTISHASVYLQFQNIHFLGTSTYL
jgi:hypothetical protein